MNGNRRPEGVDGDERELLQKGLEEDGFPRDPTALTKTRCDLDQGVVVCSRSRSTFLVIAFLVLLFVAGVLTTLVQPRHNKTSSTETGEDEVVNEPGDDQTDHKKNQNYGGSDDYWSVPNELEPHKDNKDDAVLPDPPPDVILNEDEVAINHQPEREVNPTTGDSTFSPTIPIKPVPKAWDLAFSPNMAVSSKLKQHPQLVFIKGLKVGGTSVAVALNQIANKYNIKLANPPQGSQQVFGYSGHCAGGALYFHHGWKSPWMNKCIQDTHFTTILREPVSQELSWLSFELNMEYFHNFPAKPCAVKQHIEIGDLRHPNMFQLLESVTHCEDTEFRKNLTFNIVANHIQSKSFEERQLRVWNTFRWITGHLTYSSLTGSSIIHILKNEYFLVGLTERLNEFLVLLALVNGWDPKVMYYRKCKPTNFDLDPRHFENYFPDLTKKLSHATNAAQVAYRWAKADYEKHVSKLGPWFPAMVKEFETGLREYQRQQRPPGSYAWKEIIYRDGRSEFC